MGIMQTAVSIYGDSAKIERKFANRGFKVDRVKIKVWIDRGMTRTEGCLVATLLKQDAEEALRVANEFLAENEHLMDRDFFDAKRIPKSKKEEIMR